MTLHWSRWWPCIQAWRGAYFWTPCPVCREPFGGQEEAESDHFASIPGGENTHRLICPSCTDKGEGCRAHAGMWRHDGCVFVEDVPLWPPQDGDLIGPPTVVFADGGLVLGPTRPELSEEILPFLGPNHTAEDAVRLNTILNPQQPAGRHRADTEETTPVSTERDDESDQGSGAEYGLVMPFVTVTSKHGPHDDESYVAGWEMGKLDTVLGLMPDSPLPATYNLTVRSDNQPQVELIAMKHGYSVIVTESDVEGWSYVELTKAEGL